LEGLILLGAYLWREICVSKSIGLALQLEGNLPFLLCITLHLRAISKYKTPGGFLEGPFNGWFFALQVWGAYYTWLEAWGNKPKEIISRLSKGNSVFFIFA